MGVPVARRESPWDFGRKDARMTRSDYATERARADPDTRRVILRRREGVTEVAILLRKSLLTGYSFK